MEPLLGNWPSPRTPQTSSFLPKVTILALISLALACLGLLYQRPPSASCSLYTSTLQSSEEVKQVPSKPSNASPSWVSSWQPANAGKSSTWKPLVFTACLPGMPKYYAPCIEDAPGLIGAEELIYPDFSIPLPVFVNSSQREEWFERHMAIFGDYGFILDKDGDRGIFTSQHGQNLVFENAVWSKEVLQDEWASPEGYCLHEKLSHKLVKPVESAKDKGNSSSKSTTKLNWNGLAVVITTPDSYSFQHFTDHFLKPFAQSERLMETKNDSKVTVLSGHPPRDEPVKHMLNTLLGDWESDAVHFASEEQYFSASKMLFPCRTPKVSPYNALRAQELLKANQKPVPLSDRKVIVYTTRTKTSNVYNGGRRVLNEAELLKKLRKYLKDRGQGEKIVLWDPSKFKDTPEMADFISQNVRAFVGPDSGAFYNYIWAGDATLFFQFVTRNRFTSGLWHDVSVLNQRYATLLVDSVNDDNDMEVNPQDVIDILDLTLGHEVGPSLAQPMYHWGWGMGF